MGKRRLAVGPHGISSGHGWRSTQGAPANARICLHTAYSLRPTALAQAAAIGTLLFALAGCGNIEPWVKPYERQALADPIMSFDANPVSSAYIDHVYEAREGARGALGGSGGGCGCN
jgi:hypothetical protein